MNVLVIAPHRDDEILGVGGTILKRKSAGHRVAVCIVAASEGCKMLPENRKLTDIVHQEMLKSHEFCGIDRYIGLPFLSVLLETYSRMDLNQAVLNAILEERPEEVYIPFWGDMQKDHQIVTEAAMVALRVKYNHPVKRIYAYETLSETGINLPTVNNAFIPNVFEDITDFLEGKKQALSYYQSQIQAFPDLRSLEAVDALAKFRGATVSVKAAEAFMLIREMK